jgi:two-component system, response regulator YesN
VILLFVDDDKISIDILSEYIKPHIKNISEVLCTYDGTEAFDVILSIKPDIIITDIKMPTMSGIQLLKKIKTIENYDPKIMIISSYSDFEYAREALKLNVVDYIVKPVDHEELVEKINQLSKSFHPQVIKDDEQIFDRVQKFVSEHLDHTLKLIEISQKYHYNASYLGRLIKDKTGLNFNDYVLKLRIIKAQSLLSTSKHLIHKISSEVGFKDPEHFTKKFKRITGLTPTEYRIKHQKHA